MGPVGTETIDDAARLRSGRFSLTHALIWMGAAPLLGGIAAWLAVMVQSAKSPFAPLLLLPLLTGVALGAMLVGLARVAQVGNRPTLWTGAVLAVAITVVGEHYFVYREWLEHIQKSIANDETLLKAQIAFPEKIKEHEQFARQYHSFPAFMRAQAARGRPIFGSYLAIGAAAWASWGIDGILILLATLGVIYPATRQPYCDRCHGWYRTLRSGRTGPELARRIADAAMFSMVDAPKAVRFRLSNCPGGCGPTRLELSWQMSDGETVLDAAWLNTDQRDRISKILDQA